MLNITAVQIHVLRKPMGPVKAFAEIIIDDCFVVRSLVVKEDQDGSHYVAMPNRKKRDNTWQDIAHPINDETRIQIKNAVIDEYERKLNEFAEQNGFGDEYLHEITDTALIRGERDEDYRDPMSNR